MSSTDLLPIGEFARRAGIAPSALRFYEQQGLLASARSGGGRRMYPRTELRRVAFIRAAQAVGLSLPDIAAALEKLPGGRTPTAADWHKLSRQWQPLLDARIAALTRLRDQLASCIRLRLPEPAALRALQPGRHGGEARVRRALPAGRQAGGLIQGRKPRASMSARNASLRRVSGRGRTESSWCGAPPSWPARAPQAGHRTRATEFMRLPIEWPLRGGQMHELYDCSGSI